VSDGRTERAVPYFALMPFEATHGRKTDTCQLRSDAHTRSMKLTAVFEPAAEGGYTCFVEEIPAAISEGETLEEAKANLLDALTLVLEAHRELAEKDLSPKAVRETMEFAE